MLLFFFCKSSPLQPHSKVVGIKINLVTVRKKPVAARQNLSWYQHPIDHNASKLWKKVSIWSLNVQGFADTLKLKNCLQLMQVHKLDILFLSESKSTSYNSYISEQHMVVLSDNHMDKNAGVG